MTKRALIDFDELMRHLMYVGVGILMGWTLASMVGVVSGSYTIDPQATLRFLLAVLVVVFARRTYWELMEWRWRRLPDDDRFGFANPLWETPRSSEHPAASLGDLTEAPE
jgi:ABC-type microcin C transport system permease subunit YejB